MERDEEISVQEQGNHSVARLYFEPLERLLTNVTSRLHSICLIAHQYFTSSWKGPSSVAQSTRTHSICFGHLGTELNTERNSAGLESILIPCLHWQK